MGVQRRRNIHMPGRGWEQEELHLTKDRAWDGSWPTARLQGGHADWRTEAEMGPDQWPGCRADMQTGGRSLRWVLTYGQAAGWAQRLEEGGRHRGRAWQVGGLMLKSFTFEASLHKMLGNRQVWLGLGVKSRPLLLLLSRFSYVRLCATPETAAHQAPPSLGFSRQEHWSGLPFPSKSSLVLAKKKKKRRLTLAFLLKVLNVRVQIYILHLYF